MGIRITDEMREYAQVEGGRRADYIRHHFGVDHLTPEETDMIGFLGEFACCEMLGIDWRGNIRENYYSIDSGDIKINDIVIDVKTETIPQPYFDAVINRRVGDDEIYGRRLINQGQVHLLEHYNFVVFGGFVRDRYTTWYPFGYMDANYILDNYEVTDNAPFGGVYTSPALPVRTSELGRINRFIEYIRRLQGNQG